MTTSMVTTTRGVGRAWLLLLLLLALPLDAPTVAFAAATPAAPAASAVDAAVYSPDVLALLSSPDVAAGQLIPGQYIVVFKDDVDRLVVEAHLAWTAAAAERRTLALQDDAPAAPAAPATAVAEFSVLRSWFVEGFKGYAARMPAAFAAVLARLPEVAFVEQDQVVKALETQVDPPSWGLARISVRDLKDAGNYTYPDLAGEGVDAYIVDTGCYIHHHDFEGRASTGAAFSTDKNKRDGNGHGTHVAGTVAGATFGVAKKARIVAVKVLNAQGAGTNSDVISGVEWVATEAPRRSTRAVGNMSLGGGASAALDAAVRAAIAAGVQFAVAAGNSAGDACKLSPARVREAVTVAASDSGDALASFSERGTCVDIVAPGVGINSAWRNGRNLTISGTSMASPHACGVLALALSAASASSSAEFPANATTPAGLKDLVLNLATRGRVTGLPADTPNLLLFAGVESYPQLPPLPPHDPPADEPPEPQPPAKCPPPRCWTDPDCAGCCIPGINC
ncbi:subtilisin-like serine protease [Cladochytrium tenue]|nr:subtilisin-like serine protease [Cladochytrium tenue]